MEALDEGTRLQDGIQHGVGILFQKFFCDFQAVAVSFAFDRGSGADAVFLRPFRDRVFDVIGAAAGVSGDFDFEDSVRHEGGFLDRVIQKDPEDSGQIDDIHARLKRLRDQGYVQGDGDALPEGAGNFQMEKGPEGFGGNLINFR